MNVSHYKQLAKQRRKAIQAVTGLAISHSQSLEIVAREENYPSWDALCGVVARRAVTPISYSLTVKREPKATRTAGAIFTSNPAALSDIRSIMDKEEGSLVVISSVTSQGKSTTTNALINDFVDRRAGHPNVTVAEHTSPKPQSLVAREFDSKTRDLLRCDPDVVIVGQANEEAVLLALRAAHAGQRVLLKAHASSAVDVIARYLVKGDSASNGLVSRLINRGSLVVVHQHLTSFEG
ncbi:Flp pilus assembly complex ATPase component TadA [Pseudomonas sp. P66]|uniref:Flp pilus assembly complex ATPase component TadA n=1 Tax=Pseudomonas arcuscaelestis TaxID=2710591 RepID=A0ABS2C0Z9_9PSED|nr:ATPase, T2SS/T4P/T4SS family [Pseudomonas arcuscaelestis]MBM5458719.1 Flp pilus assembly complex ATPase component TadA [Pseudomonas arcuscaelestis]